MTELEVKFNSEEKELGCPELSGNTALEQEICLKDVDPLKIDVRCAAPDPAADPLRHERVLENATKEAEIASVGSTNIPSCVNMKITKDLDSVESKKSYKKRRDDNNPSISCDNGTKDKLSHNNNILNNNLGKASNESLQNGTSSKKTLETLTSNTTMNVQQTSKDTGIAKSSTLSVVKEASPEDKEVEGCSHNVSEQKMETLFSKSPINLDEIEFDNGATEDDVDCKLDSRDEDELLLSPDENEKPAAGFRSQNGDIQHATNTEPRKKRSEESELETPVKKLCQEVEKAFPNHDNMINDYIISATKNNVDEIQRHTEQLLSEIQTLRELAQKKELEWNNILHLKKVKEEILLRLLRRKQVLSFEKTEINQVTDGQPNEINFDFLMQPKGYAIDRNDEVSGLAIKQPMSNVNRVPNCNINSNNNVMMLPINTGSYGPLSIIPPPYTERSMTSVASNLPKQILPKPVVILPNQKMPMYPCELNDQLQAHLNQPMGRQGPIKDVKSIIADYRQRHPEIVPRRGRRMKSILNPQAIGNPRPMAPQMDQRIADLSYLMSNVDANQKSILEKLHGQTSAAMANGIAFKDVLVHWQNSFSQQQLGQPVPQPSAGVGLLTTKSEKLPPPPPYPEISLHPVVSSATENSGCQQPISQAGSLLHGILTKQSAVSRASTTFSSFSPTLAKLLTTSEKQNCGEITITPVQPSPTPQVAEKQTEEVVQLDDEESGGDETEPDAEGAEERRLVIDEGGDAAADGEVPNCQGCKRRHAQFVCAGCANQWYCSRECQVAAWDEHSEMCSG